MSYGSPCLPHCLPLLPLPLRSYGAHAVCPYLAYESCRQWRVSPRTVSLIKTGKVPDVSVKDAQKNFKKSVEKGILKILSKMGISLLQCYHGAQIFEAYGLGSDLVELCFKGSVSRIGGMSLQVSTQTGCVCAGGADARTRLFIGEMQECLRQALHRCLLLSTCPPSQPATCISVRNTATSSAAARVLTPDYCPLCPPPAVAASQDLQREAETFWSKAFPEKAMSKLEDYGFIQVGQHP